VFYVFRFQGTKTGPRTQNYEQEIHEEYSALLPATSFIAITAMIAMCRPWRI